MPDDRYTPGTDLEIPGLEAILEYGDASTVRRDRIPGAMLINDHSQLDRVRITQMDGLHDDPEGSETRQPNPDRHGERAGNMFYRGRTVGLTGRVEAGNISAMRNNWRRFRGQFGTTERDLLVHHPYEIGALVNEVANPSFTNDGSWWQAPASTGGGTASALSSFTEGLIKIGSMWVTGATGAGTLWTHAFPLSVVNGVWTYNSEWDGEDVWLTACVKVQSSSGTVTSLALGLAQSFTALSPVMSMSSNQALVASPATGTWYTITTRILASAIAPTATYVMPFLALNFSGAGTYTARFHRCASVLLDPSEPSPAAYFDGDTSGFGWQSVAKQSKSIGPTYAENKIYDPRFEVLTTGTKLLTAWGSVGSGQATYNTPPSRSTRWSGDHVDASLYVKATKLVNSSEGWGVQATNSNGVGGYSVVGQRIYRFSAKINTLQKPVGGVFNLAITWLDESGGVISTYASEVIVLGESDASVTWTAPARACQAQALVQVTGATTIGNVLEFFLSDPCFVDITEWDPGDFYGVGDPAEETGNRRRIPRPFLLQKIRKTSDMKAPEQQTRNRAWRDFTMSLRASDPRVYCIDQRRRSYEMPLVSQMEIAMQPPSSFTIGPNPAPVPVGATYEGHNIPATVEWTQVATPPVYGGATTPFGGVNFDLWPTGFLIASPASPVLGRFYRSSEGYTYTEPRVIAGCSPVVLTSAYIGHGPIRGYGNVVAVSDNAYFNSATVLLKRVSSTVWLELRWNALSNGRANVMSASPPPTPEPWAFELWCSHNTSGTLSTTRLATWDYLSTSTASLLNVPFDPAIQKAYLDVSLVSNVVSWSMWIDGYPGPIGFDSANKVEAGSYTLPAGLAAVIGSAVAGHAGFALKVDNPPDSVDWKKTSANPPFVHYLRFSNASEVAPVVEVPVIGDSDTIPEIVLTGMMENPVISIQTPREDGSLDSYSVIFEGTIGVNEQLIIGNGKIVDGSGANRYSLLQPGSRVPELQPGINYISLSATDWTESLYENMSIAWRDALK